VGANTPPESGILVPADDLQRLIHASFTAAGAAADDAALMARLLVQMDLRGVHSHGTQQTPGYTSLMRQGKVNPRPHLRVVHETPTTRVIDGDGGMGHLPCYDGTRWAVETARRYGTAAVTTRNHFHFGAASQYTLLAIEHDCIGIAISSHRYPLNPESPIGRVNGASPISIAIPAGRQPPLVLDMGAGLLPWDAELFQRSPFSYFKELGIAAVNRSLGGVIAGIYQPAFEAPQSPWESNQGSFISVYDLACFMPLEEAKAQMDRFIAEARAMRPFPGFAQAELPGGLEWQRQQDYARHGIPISPGHQQALQAMADELGLATPFAACEHTRFTT
jgi:LDH2 family malate/lactate/ureidoglycolate dehydrogenase